jgi:hypothetical protein
MKIISTKHIEIMWPWHKYIHIGADIVIWGRNFSQVNKIFHQIVPLVTNAIQAHL